MTDRDDLLLLHALADQELDVATALPLERRIAADPALAAEYERIVALKQAVGRLARPAVSPEFHARIAALSPGPVRRPVPRRGWPSADWRALAASVVLAACLASGGTYLLTVPRGEAAIEAAVASGHRRSLLASSPFDVASSDRHTVKPWLDGKIGVSPPAPDLTAAGFPLVGGRVDVVAGRTVPTLVYRHRQHLISVFAIPTDSRDTTHDPVANAVDGYNMVHWSRGGFQYWAASDLDAADLNLFAREMISG